MPRRGTVVTAVLAAMTLAAAACGSAQPLGTAQPSAAQSSPTGTAQSKYFIQADFDRQMAQRRIAPQGEPATPWLQMIQPTMVDTQQIRQAWYLILLAKSVADLVAG